MQVSTTIRVSEETRGRFARMADETGRPMTHLVEEAADALERRLFFDQIAGRYAELRADPKSWNEVEAERAIEDGPLSDRSE